MNGPLFTKPSRRLLIGWGALALLNLAAGVVVSSQTHRLYDLESMMRWGSYWLVEGTNVYEAGRWGLVDYPPNAVVLLSPLGLVTLAVAHPIWLLMNIAMAMLAPYYAARFFRPHEPFRVVALPILMFLCWGGVRTLTQFTLVALTCSMAAMAISLRRPIAGGAWLGLAMMKPQVAVPVFLWSLFTRRWSMVVTSLAVIGGLVAIYCVRADARVIEVTARYVDILALHHTGDAILSGISELRPLIVQLVAESSDVDVLATSIALGLLAGICMAGFLEGAVRKRVLYAAPPLVACWSLMTFYHLTYGFVILLPVMMLLALNDAPRSRLRRSLFWLLQLGMMFDIPGLGRRADIADSALFRNALAHADRALMVALFVGLVALAWREPPEAAGASLA
ncbi:MAG TPA: glycosyltransferase family 87 protein [Vicinamibacterales bacterium]|nr:glycosyltransferase family 87 protein [Vicinamibacterales bacterium]